MSTRSRIGIIRLKPGSGNVEVESIYCHFDGYPTGVGAKLRDHWMTPEKVDALIALGDLSQLSEELGEDIGTGRFDMRYTAEGGDPHPTWTMAYGRDRGEVEAVSVRHQATEWPDYGHEWEYLFDPSDRSWTCREISLRTGAKEWKPLAAAIAADRLEELRVVLRNENISYGELAELQNMVEYIAEGDVELLEAAGVPEFPESS